MLMIRLQRVGRKNIPIFRVVVTDKQNSTKSGKYLGAVGSYDPRQGGIRQFKNDRIKYWLSQGAKPSGTVHNLLIDEKIIEGKKRNVSPRKHQIGKVSTASGVSGAPTTKVIGAPTENVGTSEALGTTAEAKPAALPTEVKGSEVKTETVAKTEAAAPASTA